MQINLPDNVRAATQADWRQLGDITSEAFFDDPVNKWIFGTNRAIKSAFTILARDVYLKNGLCYLAGDGGATMWSLADANRNPPPMAMLSLVSGVMRWGTKGAIKRAIAAGEVMDANHPHEPHMYLFTIGTRRAARGKGLGKALIRPMLEACDHDGLPAYLENSNPENTGFYMSHGFDHMKYIEVGPGAPPLQAMWRKPKPS
ncbi:MAG: GNAT family N-acetyltransferase [Alphaproteobacteria bacterium]|nr:GNAT family N-acetyltransferase [Alphaproteobacteria bacterium]MBU2085828.1 GNAT family N-acetyltransferase [Alphaproteobacteria bacterium]MBU2141904.1 GNAT family N-acetyltransferase [Alphaproteobacteria bacterium]MBU2195282.1 GNAT family N-acetyltransferase [Alphaproteobacteria bacterium]